MIKTNSGNEEGERRRVKEASKRGDKSLRDELVKKAELCGKLGKFRFRGGSASDSTSNPLPSQPIDWRRFTISPFYSTQHCITHPFDTAQYCSIQLFYTSLPSTLSTLNRNNGMLNIICFWNVGGIKNLYSLNNQYCQLFLQRNVIRISETFCTVDSIDPLKF